jgi:two-component system alkaline phosphatase synthesis response regulator PhoP
MSVILVVDDQPKIAHLVRDYLENTGFQVLTAYDGQTALAQFRHERPDLVVLDLNLPPGGTADGDRGRPMDGLDVTRAIRREGNTPIIMLTARVEETDRIIGLELGADDYVTKPFSPRELVARVRAVLRRTSTAETPVAPIHVGELSIDAEKRLVYRNHQALALTTTEFDLLLVLARNPGRVFSRMELLDRVQGMAYEGYERTIDVHIKNLRKKIEPTPRQPRYILTVYGAGYRFAETVDA